MDFSNLQEMTSHHPTLPVSSEQILNLKIETSLSMFLPQTNVSSLLIAQLYMYLFLVYIEMTSFLV